MEDPAATLLSGLAYLAVALALAVVVVGSISAILQSRVVRRYRRSRIRKRLGRALYGMVQIIPFEMEGGAIGGTRVVNIDAKATQDVLAGLDRLTMTDLQADWSLRELIEQNASLLRQLVSEAEPRDTGNH